jgi:hypothetical protein
MFEIRTWKSRHHYYYGVFDLLPLLCLFCLNPGPNKILISAAEEKITQKLYIFFSVKASGYPAVKENLPSIRNLEFHNPLNKYPLIKSKIRKTQHLTE